MAAVHGESTGTSSCHSPYRHWERLRSSRLSSPGTISSGHSSTSRTCRTSPSNSAFVASWIPADNRIGVQCSRWRYLRSFLSWPSSFSFSVRSSKASRQRALNDSPSPFTESETEMTIRFAVIGINHNHIYGQANCLVRAGATFTGFHAPEDDLASAFAARYPQVPRIDSRDRILDDRSINLVVSAGINADRAPLGIEVMRAGKDYMTDKPGVTSLEQLAEVRRVQAETGRIYSICYSEHFAVPCVVKAGEIVHSGAIGTVLNIVGLGPHRFNRPSRPDWFFRRQQFGGILTDIASHQVEQLLFFTGTENFEVVSATVANRATPADTEMQDFGE